jgi:hypothetical protein
MAEPDIFTPGTRIAGPNDYMFAPTYHHESRPFDAVRMDRYKNDVNYIREKVRRFFKRGWERISRKHFSRSASPNAGPVATSNTRPGRRRVSFPWNQKRHQRQHRTRK